MNILDNYDVSTYHLKLFVAPFVGVNLDNAKPGIIIAESGVTDISFKNLEFESIFGYVSHTYTSVSTVFKFVLAEPLGASLLDRMREAANKIGANNFIKIPFFIEITFKGRDKSSGNPVVIPIKKVFPVHITNMKINVNKGGSEYSCTAVLAHDYALSDQHGVIKKPLVLEVEDLEDALEKIANHLNSQQYSNEERANHKANNSKDVISFNLDPEIKAEGQFISSSPQETKSGRNDVYLETSDVKTTLHINDGTSIARIVDILMVNTKYLQKRVSNQVPGQNRKNAHKEKDLYKISTNVKIDSYDTGKEDYNRNITYNIVPFSLYTGIANPGEREIKTLPKDFTGKISKNAEVVKVYDYIFAGTNTEVINFDFDINLAWFMALPVQYGYHTNPVRPDPGKQYDTKDGKTSNTFKKQEDEINASDNLVSVNATNPDGNTQVYAEKPKNPEGVFPPTFLEYPVNSDSKGIIEPERTSSRGITSSLMKTYLSNNVAEFIKLKLSVRGDPMWLVNSSNLQMYFIFNVGLPEEPTSNGLIPPPKNTLITGLYHALRVKHIFHEGKYEQVVSGVRDILTKIKG